MKVGVAFISHIYIDCNLNQHMQTSATTLHMHNRHKDLQDFSNERGGTTDMGFVFCCTGTVSAAQALYLLHKHCVLHFERPFSVSETFGHKHFWVLGIAAYTYRTWGGAYYLKLICPPPPLPSSPVLSTCCVGVLFGAFVVFCFVVLLRDISLV